MSTPPIAETYGGGTGPRCGQGRLAIRQRTHRVALYRHGEECETGWRHPDEMRSGLCGVPTLREGFQSCDPAREDIRARRGGVHHGDVGRMRGVGASTRAAQTQGDGRRAAPWARAGGRPEQSLGISWHAKNWATSPPAA